MKARIVLFTLACSSFFCFSAHAQGLLDKVDRALNKVDRAASQADRAGKVAGKAGKLAGKKEKKTEEVSTENTGSSTVFKISGIDYSQLQQLQENIESCKGVASATAKFNKSGSTISVEHSSTTDDLLKEVLQKAGKIVGKDAIQSVEEGSVEIALQ